MDRWKRNYVPPLIDGRSLPEAREKINATQQHNRKLRMKAALKLRREKKADEKKKNRRATAAAVGELVQRGFEQFGGSGDAAPLILGARSR